MNIIGLSAFYHQAACCLLQNGRLTAAAAQERFSRLKHDPKLPVQAFRYCLQAGNLNITDIDALAFYESPNKKVDRQRTYSPPQTFVTRDNTYVQEIIRDNLGYEGPIYFFDHHQSHAAAAFFYSGFTEAAILTVDGVGEWATTTYGHGHQNSLTLFEEVVFPHSLGLLYATLTAYLGFRVNNGEYKVMGLAPYGQPRYLPQLQQLITLGEKGQYKLNLPFFDFMHGERMYNERLITLLGQPPRQPETAIEPFHCDVARSLQQLLEEILLTKITYLAQQVDSPNLCLAGGVALNCVANGRIHRQSPFRHLFIPPAPGDDGGCLGAAALAHIHLTGQRHSDDPLSHPYLGPYWSTPEIAHLLTAAEIPALDFREKETALLTAVVQRLLSGQIIGWFQGRLEFGPRALGNRSILANPMLPDMQNQINQRIKQRESFRPFAPSVLETEAAAHFDLPYPSPFMLETCAVQSPLTLPAITHVDGSARPQTVNKQQNPRYAALLEQFYQQSGCPILLNTSFNMRGEPIVCTPTDALLCFGRSGLDSLVLGDFLIDRTALPANWQTLCTLWPQRQTSPFKQNKSVIHEQLYTFV